MKKLCFLLFNGLLGIIPCAFAQTPGHNESLVVIETSFSLGLDTLEVSLDGEKKLTLGNKSIGRIIVDNKTHTLTLTSLNGYLSNFPVDKKNITLNLNSQQQTIEVKIGPFHGISVKTNEPTQTAEAAEAAKKEAAVEAERAAATKDYSNDLLKSALSGDFSSVGNIIKNRKLDDINVKDNNGRTVLMYAAINGKDDIVKLLVEKGAKVNLRANNGDTASTLAYDLGEIDIYNYLKAHGAVAFEPKQTPQAAPASTPQSAPSTTNVYVPSPSPAPTQSRPAAPAAPAGWNLSVLYGQNNIGGTWTSSVGNGFMVLNGNGSSGSVTIQANGKNSMGSASISGNTLNIYITSGQFSGQQFAYRIVSNKLIQGDGENFRK
jgi:hypothetical protein